MFAAHYSPRVLVDRCTRPSPQEKDPFVKAQPLCFDILAHSFALFKTTTPSLSIVSALLCKNMGGGGLHWTGKVPIKHALRPVRTGRGEIARNNHKRANQTFTKNGV